MKFNEAISKYLAMQKASNKFITYQTQECRIRKHLEPYLKEKNIPLTLDEEIELKQQINDANISQGYKHTLWVVYKQLLNFISRYLGIETKSHLQGFKKASIKYTIWTIEDYLKFRKTLKKQQYKVFFDTLFFSGARRGEILGLKPKNLINHNKISIERTYTRNKETSPKTEESKRTITLPETVYNELKEEADKCGNNNRIFYKISYTTIKRLLDKGAKKADLPRPRVHDLRHSALTILLYEGFTPQGVAKRAGHKDIATLLNVYASYLTKEDEKISKRLENKIKKWS